MSFPNLSGSSCDTWTIEEIDGSDLINFDDVFIGFDFRSLSEISDYSFPKKILYQILVFDLRMDESVIEKLWDMWDDSVNSSDHVGKAMQFLLSKIPRLTVINMHDMLSVCIIPHNHRPLGYVNSMKTQHLMRYNCMHRILQNARASGIARDIRVVREKMELLLASREAECMRTSQCEYCDFLIDNLDDLCNLDGDINMTGRIREDSSLGLYLIRYFGRGGDWLNIHMRFQATAGHPFDPPIFELTGRYASAYNEIAMGDCAEAFRIMSTDTHLWSPAMTASKVFMDTLAEFNASNVVIPHARIMACPEFKFIRRRGLLYIKCHCREIIYQYALCISNEMGECDCKSDDGVTNGYAHVDKLNIVFVAKLLHSDRICIPGLVSSTIAGFL